MSRLTALQPSPWTGPLLSNEAAPGGQEIDEPSHTVFTRPVAIGCSNEPKYTRIKALTNAALVTFPRTDCSASCSFC